MKVVNLCKLTQGYQSKLERESEVSADYRLRASVFFRTACIRFVPLLTLMLTRIIVNGQVTDQFDSWGNNLVIHMSKKYFKWV